MLCTKDDLLLSVNAFMPNQNELNSTETEPNEMFGSLCAFNECSKFLNIVRIPFPSEYLIF